MPIERKLALYIMLLFMQWILELIGVYSYTSQILGIRGWRRPVEDREVWSPGPRRGCSAIDGWMDGRMVYILFLKIFAH